MKGDLYRYFWGPNLKFRIPTETFLGFSRGVELFSELTIFSLSPGFWLPKCTNLLQFSWMWTRSVHIHIVYIYVHIHIVYIYVYTCCIIGSIPPTRELIYPIIIFSLKSFHFETFIVIFTFVCWQPLNRQPFVGI